MVEVVRRNTLQLLNQTEKNIQTGGRSRARGRQGKERKGGNPPNLSGLCATYANCASRDLWHSSRNLAGVYFPCHSLLMEGVWNHTGYFSTSESRRTYYDRSLNPNFIHVLQMLTRSFRERCIVQIIRIMFKL